MNMNIFNAIINLAVMEVQANEPEVNDLLNDVFGFDRKDTSNYKALEDSIDKPKAEDLLSRDLSQEENIKRFRKGYEDPFLLIQQKRQENSTLPDNIFLQNLLDIFYVPFRDRESPILEFNLKDCIRTEEEIKKGLGINIGKDINFSSNESKFEVSLSFLNKEFLMLGLIKADEFCFKFTEEYDIAMSLFAGKTFEIKNTLVLHESAVELIERLNKHTINFSNLSLKDSKGLYTENENGPYQSITIEKCENLKLQGYSMELLSVRMDRFTEIQLNTLYLSPPKESEHSKNIVDKIINYGTDLKVLKECTLEEEAIKIVSNINKDSSIETLNLRSFNYTVIKEVFESFKKELRIEIGEELNLYGLAFQLLKPDLFVLNESTKINIFVNQQKRSYIGANLSFIRGNLKEMYKEYLNNGLGDINSPINERIREDNQAKEENIRMNRDDVL